MTRLKSDILYNRTYFKHNIKEKILTMISKLSQRIRKVYINPKIILFGDINPNKYFTIKNVEKKLKLKTSQLNKNIITREQR